MVGVASKATKVAEGSDHDERSVPVSPPSSGIDRERGDEDHPCPPTGKQAAKSGNVEQPRDRANGNMPRESSRTRDDEDEDGQAISAVALLLLAASATSQTKLPVAPGATGGVSANGSPVAEGSSPSSADAASGTSFNTAPDTATRARQWHASQGFAAATPAAPNTSGGGETWPTSTQPVFRPNDRFADHARYGFAGGQAAARRCSGGGWVGGDRGSDAGGSRGDWASGGASKQDDAYAPRLSPMRFSSLAQLSANDGLIPPATSAPEDGRASGRRPHGNELPAGVAAVKVIGQQPFSPHNSAPSAPSTIDHNYGSWDDGRDGLYGTPPLQSSESVARGGRVFPGGAAQAYGESGAEACRGRGRDPAQLPLPRRPSSLSSPAAGPPRIQPTWRHDETRMATPASVSMRVSAAVSPRGRRSPSPTRSAGRRKPGGYRSTAGEGVGRGWKAMSAGGCGGGGGGGGGGSGVRGGRANRRWTPQIARSVVVGKDGSNGGSGCGNGRDGAGRQPDAIFQQNHHHKNPNQQYQLPQQHQQHQQHQRHHQQGETGQGNSGWSRKRSRIVIERDVDGKEEGEEDGEEEGEVAVREKLQPSSVQATTSQVAWKHSRAAMRAAAAVSTGHSQPSKRHRLGGALQAPMPGSLKIAESQRPRAMDLDMGADSGSSGIAPAAANKGTAAYPGRTSPRKKSKNLVWSQFRKACDRCTDKKVRCDGSNPTGGFKACTPCKKAGVSCLFGICRRSGPRNDFEKVTERLGQCRTSSCRFVNEDGSFWREHFHCRVGDCSFAGKNMSELLLHRGKDHPESTTQLPEVIESSATVATAAAGAAAASDEPLPSDLVKEIAAPCEGGVVC
eukprot:g4244.t1